MVVVKFSNGRSKRCSEISNHTRNASNFKQVINLQRCGMRGRKKIIIVDVIEKECKDVRSVLEV